MITKLAFSGERASIKDKGGINLARYIYALKYSKNKKLLEIGSGSGYGAYYLSKHGVKEVKAIEPDKRAVEYAKKNFISKNLQYVQSKVEEVELKDKFDTIITFEVIEHLHNPHIMLKKVNSFLKLRGVFIVSTPNRVFSSYDGNRPTNPYHIREYYNDEFISLLKKHFSTVSCFGIFLKEDKSKVESDVQLTWRWKLANKLTKKRWVRRIINYLPERPKRIFTGENNLEFSPSDYIVKRKNPEKAPYLLAVCRK